MSDIQGQLNLQNKLLQSIKDELAGVKRALSAQQHAPKGKGDFHTDRLDVMASNVRSMADTVWRDSHRIQAIMAHLGLPEVEIEGDEVEQRS
jgi:hypothetical protein